MLRKARTACPEHGRGVAVPLCWHLLGLAHQLRVKLGLAALCLEDLRESIDRSGMPRNVGQVVAKRGDALLRATGELADDAGDVQTKDEPPLDGRAEKKLPAPQVEQLIPSLLLGVEPREERDGDRVVGRFVQNAPTEIDGAGGVAEPLGG